MERLVYLNNCNIENRVKEWKNFKSTSGKIFNETTFGCTLNTLLFLNSISLKNAIKAMNIIRKLRGQPNGSLYSFIGNFEMQINDMILFIAIHNKENPSSYYPNTLQFNKNNLIENIKTIFSKLDKILPNNACTLFRLNSNKSIQGQPGAFSGHTMIIAKNNNVIYTLDPQVLKDWKYDENLSPAKIANVWKLYQSLTFISTKINKTRSISKFGFTMK